MLVVAGLLLSTVLIVIAGILGWAVYKLAEVRRDMASTDDLNRVIDHLNSLSHGVHRSHQRSEQRIEKTEGDVRSANETGVTIKTKLDSLAASLKSIASSAENAEATGARLGASVAGLGKETEFVRADVAKHENMLSSANRDITDTKGRVQAVARSIVPIKALADSFPTTYAKWNDFAGRDLVTKSITLKGPPGTTGGKVDAKGVSADRYDFKQNGSVVGHVGTTADGKSMQFVSGGAPVAEVSGSGIRWGTSELKVDRRDGGNLKYCQNNVCYPVTLTKEVPVAPAAMTAVTPVEIPAVTPAQ